MLWLSACHFSMQYISNCAGCHGSVLSVRQRLQVVAAGALAVAVVAASLAQALTPSLLPVVAMGPQPTAPQQQPHPHMPPTRCQALVSMECCPAVGIRPLLIRLRKNTAQLLLHPCSQHSKTVPCQHLLQALMGAQCQSSVQFSTPVGLLIF